MNIKLSFEQGTHETVKVGWIGFDHDKAAFGKRKIFGNEQLAGAIRIIHHDANNGAISRIEHHEAEHMDGLCTEQPDEIMQAPNLIGCEDGELNDRIYPTRLRSCGRHN